MQKLQMIPLVVSLLLFIPYCQAQNVPLPPTPTGKIVGEYIDGFNSGGENIRRFFLTHISDEDLRRVTLEQRLRRYQAMHERLGTLELRRTNVANDSSFSGLFHGSLGSLVNIDFEFEPVTPHHLRGIRVEDAGRDQMRAPSNPMKNDEEFCRAVDRYAGQRTDSNLFSGVLLVVRNGKPLIEKAYGYADRDRKIPNSVDTRFNIGSINKLFTGLAIRRLASAGALSLKDTIGRFLPDYPNPKARHEVTIEQLLDMTSGIGDFFGDRYESTPKEQIRTLREYLPLFADKPLEFEPGAKRRYSNGGFIVLGRIIEEVSGMDYYRYIREKIFLPAEMTHTDWFAKDSLPPDCAYGYTGAPDSLISNTPTLPGRGSSAGGGYSTVHDLLAYTKALSAKTILAEHQDPPNGFAVAGGAQGLNAAFEWNPGKNYTIIVMSNLDPPSAETVQQQIAGWLPK